MKKAELSISDIDEQLPALAKTATRNAHRRALRSDSVVVYRDGELRRIEAGGVTVLKSLEPPVKIKKGTRFEIKD